MAAVLTCGRSECGVSKTGICAEGHTPPESCPSFGQAAVDVPQEFEDDPGDEVESTSQVIKVNEPVPVALLSGEPLRSAEVDQFLRWKPVRFVTIVGEFDSGKTTLICALYERFLKGEFAHYLFAGSRTLVGFEKRSHHSRTDSGRARPDTLRTSLSDGLQYFHLSLVKEDAPRSRVELMLSDRAGEQYQKASSNSVLVDELIEVKKAQYVVLLLDGGRLADPVQRSGTMQAVRQTIRAFLDGGALTRVSRVQVVTTKIDLLKGVAQKENLKMQVEKFRNSLIKDFSHRLGDLSFFKIAARDPHGELSAAHGMEDLLTSWCVTVPSIAVHEPLRVALTTEFDRLLLRTRAEEVR